jgi:hypothetical protein
MCRNGQVTVTELNSQGAAGTFYVVLGFTDTSNSNCTLTGYPGVATLNAQGVQVAQALRGTLSQGAIQAVKLTAGQTASATLSAVDIPIGGATSCAYYRAVLVTPPGLTVSQRVSLPSSEIPGCASPHVFPLEPGTAGGM